MAILLVHLDQRGHASLFHNLRVHDHRRQQLSALCSAVRFADPVVAAGRLEEGLAGRDDARRALVHLVEQRAFEDVRADRGAGVAMRRGSGVGNKIDEEADARLAGAVGQAMLVDEGGLGEGAAASNGQQAGEVE